MAADFEGYTDARETEKKILRDVFERGDSWFRSGDLMLLDAQGYFHFVDRIGDTFRWKGENVATSEVNDVLRDCAGVIGVAVPSADGRAGMAAVIVDDTSSLAQSPTIWRAGFRRRIRYFYVSGVPSTPPRHSS